MPPMIETTTAEEIQDAEALGADAYHTHGCYRLPSEYRDNPWLEAAWRRGYVRAKVRNERFAAPVHHAAE